LLVVSSVVLIINERVMKYFKSNNFLSGIVPHLAQHILLSLPYLDALEALNLSTLTKQIQFVARRLLCKNHLSEELWHQREANEVVGCSKTGRTKVRQSSRVKQALWAESNFFLKKSTFRGKYKGAVGGEQVFHSFFWLPTKNKI
jgi:hypothetical protein